MSAVHHRTANDAEALFASNEALTKLLEAMVREAEHLRVLLHRLDPDGMKQLGLEAHRILTVRQKYDALPKQPSAERSKASDPAWRLLQRKAEEFGLLEATP